MNAPAIKIQNLSFSYPSQHESALRNINLEISEGEWVSVMGPTGAGKSTMSLCMNGLIPNIQAGEMKGSVSVFGMDTYMTSIPALSSKVGVIFQDFNTQLFSSRTDLEIAFAMENLCESSDTIKKKVGELLEGFGLTKYSKRHPSELSGGERQRLAIASVFALSPRILVLDEPATDLDPLNRENLLFMIRQMHKSGITVIWIDHEPELSFESKRLILMDRGEMAHDTHFREFFAQKGLALKYSIKQPDIPMLFKDEDPADMPMTCAEALKKIENMSDKSGWRLSKERQKDYISRKPSGHSDKVIIGVENLSYTYPNGTHALNGINLEIREGEFVAIIGQNGSGKTTLAKHFNGLLKPASGRIIVKGYDTRYSSIYELSRNVGFCFQNPDNQIFASTVREEVSFGPRNYKFPQSCIDNYVRDALEAVNLTGLEDKDPFVLTKGERQRIAVASILSIKPGIMIFDEPTTGLDYKQMTSMMDMIERLNAGGCTIIIITHSMWVAAKYARRCIVMSEGKILLDAETREVFAKEEILKGASLLPPDIVRLGNALGVTTLSVEEFIYCSENRPY
ncbi:ABC transporter ATP-binding protein [bacterium]|nr:ABC transporter ATP-binding protein [bacterium]